MVSLVMCHSAPETLGNPSRTATATPSPEQVSCLLWQGSRSEVTPWRRGGKGGARECFTEKKSWTGVGYWLPKNRVSWVFRCRSAHFPVQFGLSRQIRQCLSQPEQGQLTLGDWRPGVRREGMVPKFLTKP